MWLRKTLLNNFNIFTSKLRAEEVEYCSSFLWHNSCKYILYEVHCILTALVLVFCTLDTVTSLSCCQLCIVFCGILFLAELIAWCFTLSVKETDFRHIRICLSAARIFSCLDLHVWKHCLVFKYESTWFLSMKVSFDLLCLKALFDFKVWKQCWNERLVVKEIWRVRL